MKLALIVILKKLLAFSSSLFFFQVGGKANPFEIEEYCSTFEKKMGSFLQPRAMLTDDDAAKLGMKNEEDEVEKFVQVSQSLLILTL